MDCKSEAASHYAGCACHEAHGQDQIARLTRERDEALRTVKALTPAANYCLQYKPLLLKAERERDEAREERDRARRDYEGACHLVAKMHHAATGAVTGPARGVVEDVADVRARLLAAESRAERLEAALREIADECDCDFPRCQSTIARAALGEEGK